MTSTATTWASHTTLTAHVHQLTRPIHIAHRGRVHTHPCLLDQLRDATNPTRSPTTGGTRTAPCSRPPARIDTLDTLATIYVGISTWHARLTLPSPPRDQDWQKAVLGMFIDAAPNLALSIADYLADEITDWWHAAAVATGWTPDQLRKLQ